MSASNASKILSFEGLISAPFTAFTPEGDVNVGIIPKYVDHLVKQGVKGAFVNGTTGEGLSMTVTERKAIAEEWVRHGKNKLEVVIIHVGANSIKDVQELATHAEKIGATGIAALPPLFYKPTTLDHLVQYFKKVSEAAPTTPLMLYHIPSYSGVEICLGEFLPKVREQVPNFIGAKFTSTEVRDLIRCSALPGPPFKIISGFDEVLLPCMASGTTAGIGATYNFMAPMTLKMVDAYKKGNIEEALKTEIKILHAIEKICRHGQGIACLKATINLLGDLDFGDPRVPLLPLDSESLKSLKEDLKNLKTEEWKRI